jgi:HSP20 family protein
MKIIRREDKNHPEPVSRDPFRGVVRMRDMMDRMFDDFWGTPFLSEFREGLGGFIPNVDVSESDKKVIVRADVPGIDPDKIDVEVTEDSITLSGKLDKSEEEKGENYYRIERRYGEFSREFLFPSRINPDSVNAESKDGVLTIELDKQPSEQRKKVSVKTKT